MGILSDFTKKIRNAIYVKDVRDAIADGLETVEALEEKNLETYNNMVIGAGESNAEIVDARLDNNTGVRYKKLGKRLDKISSQIDENTNRLSNIVAQAGTDNTEIVDMRTVNGTTYATSGDALRAISSGSGIKDKAIKNTHLSDEIFKTQNKNRYKIKVTPLSENNKIGVLLLNFGTTKTFNRVNVKYSLSAINNIDTTDIMINSIASVKNTELSVGKMIDNELDGDFSSSYVYVRFSFVSYIETEFNLENFEVYLDDVLLEKENFIMNSIAFGTGTVTEEVITKYGIITEDKLNKSIEEAKNEPLSAGVVKMNSFNEECFSYSEMDATIVDISSPYSENNKIGAIGFSVAKLKTSFSNVTIKFNLLDFNNISGFRVVLAPSGNGNLVTAKKGEITISFNGTFEDITTVYIQFTCNEYSRAQFTYSNLNVTIDGEDITNYVLVNLATAFCTATLNNKTIINDSIAKMSNIKEMTLNILGRNTNYSVDDYIYFTVPVNQNFENSSTESSVQDSEKLEEVWCALKLPKLYKSTGNPSKLCVFMHGAGGVIYNGNYGELKHANVLLDNGYAILDCAGVPGTVTTEGDSAHMGGQRALEAYLKAIQYVQKHYNVENKIYLHGHSMGGLTALNFINCHANMVKAVGLFFPVTDLYNQAWLHPWYNTKTKIQIAEAYNFKDKTGETYEADKVIGYNPIVNKSVVIGENRYNMLSVPLKIWHGTADTTVSLEGSEAFVTAIKNAGGQATLRIVDNMGHGPTDTVKKEELYWFNRF